MHIKPTVYHSGSSGDEVAIIKTNPCNLMGIIVENFSANSRYMQVFDSAEAPEAGDVPLIQLKLPAGTQSSVDSSVIQFLPLSNGLVIAMSSTGNTYTATNADEMFLTVFTSESA